MAADWGVIFATLLGPILAVWASEWRALRRQTRDTQEKVFFSLMTTRASRLQPGHIAALNRIDIAFPARRHPAIADAWAQYLRLFSESAVMSPPWLERANNQFADLMKAMADELHIPLSMDAIKNAAYHPQVFVTAENQLNEIRMLILELLRNYAPKPHQQDQSKDGPTGT